ncbi:MAG: hypothetical protein JNK65_07580, partial [Deltaproteobacteria bacterium]|nr:hypothetical protein [Deltaproteobacteria bacterium]
MKKQIFKSALLAASAFFIAANVQAATFNVTPTTSGCTGTDDCTLEEALNKAEANGEDDIINLAAGTYDLSIQADYFTNGAEDFDLTIQGSGPDTILDGKGDGT